MNPLLIIPIALVAVAIGVLVGYRYRQSVTEKKIGRTEEYAKSCWMTLPGKLRITRKK